MIFQAKYSTVLLQTSYQLDTEPHKPRQGRNAQSFSNINSFDDDHELGQPVCACEIRPD